MWVLWRYILKEHIGPFIFANCVITLVFVLNLVFRELPRILSRGLGFTLVVEFFFLNLAWIVALAVPMAVLVAALMAFGRLSGDNEITAMKASGISVLRIMTPVLFMAVVLALFLVWFNNAVLPEFNHRARLLASDIARKRPTLTLEAGVLYRDLPNYTLLVQNIVETPDTAYVDSVFIDDNSEPNASKFITADRGKIYLNPRNGQLTLILYDGIMYELNLDKMEEYRQLRFPKQVLSIMVPDMVMERSNSEYRGDREKSAGMMRIEISDNSRETQAALGRMSEKIMRFWNTWLPQPPESLDRKHSAPEFPLRLSRILTEHQRLRQELAAEKTFIDGLKRKNYELSVEVHKKYSIPFACIIFVLIGAPLGMMARKGSMAMAAGISFGFFLLYWATLIGGEELADKGLVSPFMAMWLANLIVGVGGIYLLLQAIHEGAILSVRNLKSLWRGMTERWRT